MFKFQCDGCSRSFASHQGLASHRGKKKCHQQLMQYKCKLCNCFIQNRQYVDTHMMVQHREQILRCSNVDMLCVSIDRNSMFL